MIHQRTFQIPHEACLPLLKQTEESGQTFEQVAGARLPQTVASPASGSLRRKGLGSDDSGLEDVSSRRHEYLGQQLHDELQGRGDG